MRKESLEQTGRQILPKLLVVFLKILFSVNKNNNTESTLLGAQGANPETPGQAPSLSRVLGSFTCITQHTRDLQLYIPSEGRSNYD